MTKELGNFSKEGIPHNHVQRCLELMTLFQHSNFKVLEGVIDSNQSTFLFEETAYEPHVDYRWGIKMVVQGNYLKLETEKKPKKPH